MVWHQSGDKPLSEAMMTQFTDIYMSPGLKEMWSLWQKIINDRIQIHIWTKIFAKDTIFHPEMYHLVTSKRQLLHRVCLCHNLWTLVIQRCIFIQADKRDIWIQTQTSKGKHTEAETKWLPFYRRYFLMHFHEWKLLNFKKYFIETCSWESNWQYVFIGSDNGLALTRWQAIIWTNDGLVYWCIKYVCNLASMS